MSLPKACPSCPARYPAEALYCAFDGSPLVASAVDSAVLGAMDQYIGHEIIGPIEIRQLVGIGSMGRVYRGFQRGIDRDVAVKILHRELSANPTVVARFHREAKVASLLAHPHVVQVLLTGQLPDGALYIVMEYLDGMSLQSALSASAGAMPLQRALHITLALCAAVGEAHAHGIVHRDLKPENVMLVNRTVDPDFVKVLDFGIARLNWGDPSMGSAPGLIFGTARYISPEGAQGDAVGPAGDVYAIATMFYQMLSGRTPFDAGQALGLLVRQIHDPAPPLQSIAPAVHVPPQLAEAVMKNLAKKPTERSANATDFGRVLLEAAVASGLSAHDLLTPRGMTSGARTASRSIAPAMPRTSPQTEMAEAAVTAPVDATMDDQRQPPASVSSGRVEQPRGGIASRSGAQAHSLGLSSSIQTRFGGRSKQEPRSRGRAGALVVACFVVGAMGATYVASRPAWLGPRRVPSLQLAEAISHANDALVHQRWDVPQEDNVRDITDDGLSRWPNEPQLLRIRTLACNDIVKVARAKRDDGNIGEALRLAKLAYRLDPSDDSAQRLAAEMESQALAPPADSVPPLASGSHPTPAMAATRTTLDASNPKPSIGQSVDFSARVVGGGGAARSKVDSPTFRVSGPGIAAGAQLDAVVDGAGVFRAAFSFPKEGRFEVVFGARVDGAPVRASRFVQVGPASQSTSPPILAPGVGSEAPAPTSSAKWL